MSRRQGVAALVVAVFAALLGLGIAGFDEPRDRDRSLYTCTVWNDRAWAGCD